MTNPYKTHLTKTERTALKLTYIGLLIGFVLGAVVANCADY